MTQARLEVFIFIFHRTFLHFGTESRGEERKDLPCLDFQEEVVSIDSVMVDLYKKH